MSNNLVGQIVTNQFRVDAFISAGGMGAVFRVWDLKRNVPLAMKVLHADLAEDQVMFERFKREARALRKLEHPNIVPFYGLYQDPSLIFLLERYIDGPTLKEVLSQNFGSSLPARDVLCIIKALCSAVGYAHSNNVIHCDIKAANVMIDKGGQIYLGDFGIARHAESDVTAMPGAGTPAYMSPEQILGKTVTRETDIYALGVLLFELLTGQRPFRGNETSSERSGNTINERIRFAHLNLPAPDPRVINPKISPAVSAIVLRALEKEPSARFSSCQELFLDLSEAYGTTAEQIPDRLSGLNVSQTPTPSGTTPDRPADLKPAITKSPLVFVGGAVVLIMAMVFFLSLGGNPGSGGKPFIPTKMIGTETRTVILPTNDSQPVGLVASTNTKVTTNEATRSAPTSTSTLAAPSSTKTRTPTPTHKWTLTPTYGSCTGAIDQKVRVGDEAKVCTRSDRLILRSDPSTGAGEIFRMYPGTKLTVIGGPKCGTNSTWWQVRVAKGSRVSLNERVFNSEDEETGWVREGSDAEDPYYICPVD